ncbi:MAG: sulfite exporter TauE/SafE family protein [Candidatus Nanopelagicales bacterium]
MAPWPWFVLAGAAVGSLTGIFGVGGSAIATPVLSLLGVPGLQAVASPLPATIPSALAAVVPYVRSQTARPRAAGWSLLGGIPATILGALVSRIVGGPALLVASGIALGVVGWRMLSPVEPAAAAAGAARRQNRPLLVAASAGVGFFTGLLANGGGFLLVPMYVLVFGLAMAEAAGTSLLVVAVLAIPTLITHVSLGHVDWAVAAAFALGSVPTAAVSGRLAQRLPGEAVRRAFGWFLIACGVAFALHRLMSA